MDFVHASPQEQAMMMVRVTMMLTAAFATVRAATQRIQHMRRRRAQAALARDPGACQPLVLNPKYRASRRELQRARREIAYANHLRQQLHHQQDQVPPPSCETCAYSVCPERPQGFDVVQRLCGRRSGAPGSGSRVQAR